MQNLTAEIEEQLQQNNTSSKAASSKEEQANQTIWINIFTRHNYPFIAQIEEAIDNGIENIQNAVAKLSD